MARRDTFTGLVVFLMAVMWGFEAPVLWTMDGLRVTCKVDDDHVGNGLHGWSFGDMVKRGTARVP
ncbi:hypothetical protein [Desulfosoma caldarium]|uniref:Uncharacterized protein n=1 Tax=Desulfosoma caldarium TaxID=610254 RepID=A0A3N1UXV7_9BACT|nr:hypothetical protein [Desulfosoma caldarium]ROQ93377.1 hypothetical protein EDC27_1392 [Desulfosoma caldarium]